MKEEKLKQIVNDLLWMAARYAHGRNTYAPGIIRETVSTMREMYPDWKPKEDKTLEPVNKQAVQQGFAVKEDYLDDIFNSQSTTT